jgi:hypothetical protein
LPLTSRRRRAPRAFLVFVTGDGGFQRVDQELADGIAKHGVTTVALSTFRYFMTKQAPEKVAADLGRIVDALAVRRQPVYAGGYSFGAEVVPDVVARNWTAAERARLGGLLLLAPSASASFKVDPLDWVRDPDNGPAPSRRGQRPQARAEPRRLHCRRRRRHRGLQPARGRSGRRGRSRARHPPLRERHASRHRRPPSASSSRASGRSRLDDP